MQEPRDYSDKAIMTRYDKANRQSIMNSDAVTFDSLRDIFYLVKQNEKLKDEQTDLKALLKEMGVNVD
jgi:hypothetical protein